MPSREDLLPLEWRFRANAHLATERMRLLPGGRIAGYRHPNEFYWDYDGARLTLMNADRQVTSVLDLASAPGEPLRFTGPYAWDASIQFELTGGEPQPWPQVAGASAERLKAQIKQHGWTVGAHTYGVPFIYEAGAAGLTIGRFCAIAEGTIIALGDHKTSNVTSYPFMTLQAAWPSRPMGADDHVSRGDVTVGNDVWIGAEAFIGSGVTIGDGAVIGARSVVTRDVPPYAVAVGSPARVVRHRFPPETIAALLTIRWWDWPEVWIDAALPLLVTERVDDLIRVGLARPESLEALVLLVDEALKPPPPPPPPPPSLAQRIVRRLRGLIQART